MQTLTSGPPTRRSIDYGMGNNRYGSNENGQSMSGSSIPTTYDRSRPALYSQYSQGADQNRTDIAHTSNIRSSLEEEDIKPQLSRDDSSGTPTSNSSTPVPSSSTSSTRKEKRRKTSRACIHCQKAHVTCDSGRPCMRCVKKGLQDSCRDGNRKRAKYLAGDDPSNIEAVATDAKVFEPISDITSHNGLVSSATENQHNSNALLPSLSNSFPTTPPDNLIGNGNIIHGNAPSVPGPASDPNSTGTTGGPNAPSLIPPPSGPNNASSSSSSSVNTQNTSSAFNHPSIPSNLGDDSFVPNDMSQYSFGSRATNLEYSILSNILRTSLESPQLQLSGGPNQTTTSTPESDISLQGAYFPELKISDFEPLEGRSNPDNSNNLLVDGPPQQTQLPLLPPTPLAPALPPPRPPQHSTDVSPHRFNSPEEVYQYVRTPFPYTQGFHALIAYLRSRFDKRHLMHMARAMAAYRPSFIATTKLLKEQDLIFMEQCFQRTLMEFEKIIASSGTPTVIWRRTGQIAAVGKEFCILTGWSPERLVSSTTFIVELMDDKSVTDYFDVFSKLAFGDSRGVSMTECTLLRPNGDKVPTACTWTVKRDVFDIPMMIIGNFLPIL